MPKSYGEDSAGGEIPADAGIDPVAEWFAPILEAQREYDERKAREEGRLFPA